MGIIALAGGTGGLGRTIQKQLEGSSHKIVVLSRSERQAPKDQSPNIAVATLKIDYSIVDDLVQLLEQHNIDTIVSTVYVQDEETYLAQLNLVEAARRASATKRFIMSEFSVLMTDEVVKLSPMFEYNAQTADKLRSSGLEWTRVANGFFMDYWGAPHYPSDMWIYTWAIDMKNCKAAIPGSGDDVLTMTHTSDVARAVVKLFDLGEWPEYSFLAGDDITMNQMLALAENVRGKKFDVTYDGIEELERGNATLLDETFSVDYVTDIGSAKAMMSMFGRMIVAGQMKIPSENRLNERLTGWKPMTFEELMEKSWRGR
ncbi:nmrA-like family protein [Ilyonectria robusta]